MQSRFPFALMWVAAATAIDAFGQGPPNYDFDWVTVSAPGNASFNIGPDPTGSGRVLGRGSVDYSFRVSRLETTTSEWLEFVNTFWTMPSNPLTPSPPTFWGAEPDPAYHGPGQRWRLRGDLPSAGLVPVAGLSWEDSARFCNWLQNGKQATLAAIQTGAYDTSLFGTPLHLLSPAQRTHLPGAQFWIPTLDEFLKATYYDPNRFGTGQPGWWLYQNSGNSPSTPGPPGQGQTSAGWNDPIVPFGERYIPLGAYPQSASPWRLLDTSGGTQEWTEAVVVDERGMGGSYAGQDNPRGFWDQIYAIGSADPAVINSQIGLRIASAVPTPGATTVLCCAAAFSLRRRRRAIGPAHRH